VSNRTFWRLIFALSLINFGIDLVIAGGKHLSVYDLMVMTGSWLVLGGLAILVWQVISRDGNGGKV
jgi:hypothetical protein